MDREGAEEYLTRYIINLQIRENDVFYLPLQMTYTAAEWRMLKKCKGVIIGGGNTARYHDYIVKNRLSKMIHTLFSEGVPVAGFSAGALLTPEECVISAKDNEQKRQLYLKGLGLLHHGVIAVHYLEWNETEPLQQAVLRTNSEIGYGIAEQSGIYFKDQQMRKCEGYVEFITNG
ncbi:Type 1 glutamine amidotransferase-like domain-containing protein [Halobacillus salinarum]|uniref:Type 1 glutamine amidotransferase-like domain-containing protein n=1 Tax=Halobacillus salinarum TaxID=2932257 RepID=A0ABY4ENE2_9BACI|nr:Type 1 glutamine amidotransferase-like domain-containing protein [Halobacillus salinarum]UOQ45179.1 Type 1 glutamine amidotransferase-like domain-containing protein [Halobacillus salinarum]